MRYRWPLWPVAVTERSMEPAYRPGDWLLAWRGARIRPGQVVIAAHPGRPGFWLIKRAVRREPGGWWLESDNTTVPAVDSRAFGPVPDAQVAARVLLRYRRGPDAKKPRPPATGTGAPS